MHLRLPYAAGSKVAPRNQTVTQQRGHSLERKKEQADTELSASAGSAVQRASSDAAAILFFLRKEAKRMGAQSLLVLQKNAVCVHFPKSEKIRAQKFSFFKVNQNGHRAVSNPMPISYFLPVEPNPPRSTALSSSHSSNSIGGCVS